MERMNENYTKLVALLETPTASKTAVRFKIDESHRWRSDRRTDGSYFTLALDDAQDELTLCSMDCFSVMNWKVVLNFNDVPFEIIEAVIRKAITRASAQR
jgi:hypothetical protein